MCLQTEFVYDSGIADLKNVLHFYKIFPFILHTKSWEELSERNPHTLKDKFMQKFLCHLRWNLNDSVFWPFLENTS